MLNKVIETAEIAIKCVEATCDTVRDQQVRDAWKEMRYNVKEINKKRNKELKKLFKQYKKDTIKCYNLAKSAKKMVTKQFSASVKESFEKHLKGEKKSKQNKRKTLAVRA